MHTIEDLRVENLKRIKQIRNWNTQDLADAIGRSHSQVSQLLTRAKHSKTGKPRVIGSDLARNIEICLGLPPGWMDGGVVIEETLQLQAQSASLIIPTVTHTEPQTLVWGDLRMNDVPAAFRAQLPDDAMGKRLPKGIWVVFDRGASSPNRRAVLVRVNGEEVYFRRVKEVDGGWIAKPDDSDFAQFDSREDSLEIIATMRHAEVPDAEE